jgi:hypothetical protein
VDVLPEQIFALRSIHAPFENAVVISRSSADRTDGFFGLGMSAMNIAGVLAPNCSFAGEQPRPQRRWEGILPPDG